MEKGTSTTCEKVRNYIPDDLALCILSKLPLKSLKRFGCVHKSWSLLFDNDHFMSIFRNNFISYHHSCYDDTSLMLSTLTDFYSLSGDDFENIVKLNLPNPFQEENCYFHVLDSGSITGILCHYKLDDGRTIFWKPTTEEFKIIPQSPLHLDSPYLNIWVDPVGYGYDKVRDDYKLLRFVHYSRIDSNECEEIGIQYIRDLSYDPGLWEIYSLRSNIWKKLDINASELHWFFQGFNGKRVHMNEMCHWWHLSPPIDDGEVDLVSFDFVDEVFIRTPTPLNIFSTRIYITGLNGSIAIISWIWDTTIFDISILGEIGVKESWIKLYSIGPFSCNIEHTIGAGYNGDIFFRKKDGNIVWYNLCTQMMEDLCIKGEDHSHVLIYKNTSFLPMGWEEY